MTLSSAPWWCAPVLALGEMATVPAHSFCAPARAKLIAALRSMPGVCGVLPSSECAGITRTPSCFHLGSLIASSTPCHWRLLPASCRARESARFLRCAEERLGLVDTFLLLGLRIGIGHDAGAGLHVHHAVLHQRGAQHDGGVHLAGGGEIADRAGVESALVLLQFVDDLHRPYLRCARDRARWEATGERVDGVASLGERALDI